MLTVTIGSCQNKKGEQKNQIQSILADSLGVNLDISKVFILSDLGCPKCNASYLEFMTSNEFDDAIFIVSNTGERMDLSSLDKLDQSHLVYDYRDFFFRSGIIDANSAFISINKREDSVINITPETLRKSLNYIQSLDDER